MSARFTWTSMWAFAGPTCRIEIGSVILEEQMNSRQDCRIAHKLLVKVTWFGDNELSELAGDFMTISKVNAI